MTRTQTRFPGDTYPPYLQELMQVCSKGHAVVFLSRREREGCPTCTREGEKNPKAKK